MTNKYQPHLHVLPEDDQNRQLAVGFSLHSAIKPRSIKVLPLADGWKKVLESFVKNQLGDLYRTPARRLVLMMDFDGDEERLSYAKGHVPDDVRERVFILGARKEPQDIKRAMPNIGTLEAIGNAQAEDCRTNTRTHWNNHELACNIGELKRLNELVRPWLFD